MSYRKGERTARHNERDLPHMVELLVPEGGFRRTLDEIIAFHDGRQIPMARGRGQRRDDRDFARWCFGTAEQAEAFRAQFGGETVQAGKRRPKRTSWAG